MTLSTMPTAMAYGRPAKGGYCRTAKGPGGGRRRDNGVEALMGGMGESAGAWGR